ncbi:MAG TPA: ABC transporter permease [Cyclobacteriaceae bacterium]|nr:ABC transporter permease [Cyclobacteriaceae bacterium]
MLKEITRSLIRSREYALINILGLAISISACLVLFYVIRFELSFDAFHKDRERIYRVVTFVERPEGVEHDEGAPEALSEAMKLNFPTHTVAAILSNPNSQIDIRDEKTNEETMYREDQGVFYTEPSFFQIFSFEWLHGTPQQALAEPNSVVLDQQTADKYFGDWHNAIGKSIEYRNTTMLKVTGIIKTVPANSDFPLKVILSRESREWGNSWTDVTSRLQCYIKLDEHTSEEEFEAQLPAWEKKHVRDESDYAAHYSLQPLSDLHFDTRYGNYGKRVSKESLMAMGIIGLLLIITASINFVNLAVAQVLKKTRDIGIRKVLGSRRWQLSVRFFSETFLVLLIASGVAFTMTEAMLPMLRPYVNLPAGYDPVTIEVPVFLLLLCLGLTFLSGSYPALVMSNFKAVHALKSKIVTQTAGGMSIRKGLVVVQFFIAQVLIIGTLIVIDQLEYFRTAPLGFNKESIMMVPVPTDSVSRTKVGALRNELSNLVEVTDVAFGFGAPQSSNNRRSDFRFDGAVNEAPFEVNMKYADPDYYKTFGLTLAAGRSHQLSDTVREYVVNETFLNKLGITDPEKGLGHTITINNVTLPIVGVVNDFHGLSLKLAIEPLVIMCDSREYRTVSLRIDPARPESAIENVRKIYASFFPESYFQFRFLEESITNQYRQEERLAGMTRIFTGLAIFISCLGLYGLISFMAVQKTKEIGIRKVLGANVADIVILFSKEFVVLVLIAFAAAAPVAWYLISDWLNGFANRVDIKTWTFAIAIGLSLAISITTIGFRSFRAAIANPVDSLRDD